MPSHGWLASCSRKETITPGKLYFDMTGDNCPNETWTISWWHRYVGSYGAANRGLSTSMSYADTNPIALQVDTANGGNLICAARDGMTNGVDLVAAYALDTWKHHVLVFHSANPCELTYYLDGVETHNTTGSSAVSSTVAKLFVGWQVVDSADDLLHVRHLMIFDGEMTEAEALAAFNLGHNYLALGVDGRFPTCADGDLTFWASFYHGLNADYSVGDGTAYYNTGGSNMGTNHLPVGRDRAGDPWMIDIVVGEADEDHPTRRGAHLVYGRHPRNSPNAEEINANQEYVMTLSYYPGDAYSNGLDLTAFIDGDYLSYERSGSKWAYTNISYENIDGTYDAIGWFPIKAGPFYYPTRLDGGAIAGIPSTTVFEVSGIGTPADNYWAGAYVDFLTGANMGVSAFVAANTAIEITISGELPEAPTVGDVVRLWGGGKITATVALKHGGVIFTMEDKNDGGNYFEKNGVKTIWRTGDTEVYAKSDGGTYARLPSVAVASVINQGSIFIGTPDGPTRPSNPPGTFNLYVRNLKLGGYGRAQVHSVLNELWDGFLCIPNANVITHISTRVCYYGNIQRVSSRANWTCDVGRATYQDFLENGTWRETEPHICHLEWDLDAGIYRVILRAEDALGTVAFGWLTGSWDSSENAVVWEDDEDSDNPFITLDELNIFLENNTEWQHPSYDASFRSIAQDFKGEWFWIVTTSRGGQDNTFELSIPLGKDSTRYTIPTEFPLVECNFGFDTTMATPNVQDINTPAQYSEEIDYYNFSRNRFRKDTPLMATGRMQVWPYGDTRAERYDAYRALACIEVVDAFHWSGWAEPNTPMSPYGFTDFSAHWPFCVMYSAETMAMARDSGSPSNSNLFFTCTDDRWHSYTNYTLVDNTDPEWAEAADWQVGGIAVNSDRTVIYVYNQVNNDTLRVMYCDRGYEAYVKLSDDETEGIIVTCVLEKPPTGWETFYLNSSLEDGNIKVGILDPLSGDTVVIGYDITDMDALIGAMAEEVTWGGNNISELNDTYDYLRIIFSITRAAAEDDSPIIYEWYCTDGQRTYDIVASSDEIIIANSEIMQQSQYDFMVTNI